MGKEYRAGRGFAFDEEREERDDGDGKHEAEEGAGGVQAAFEGAVEEPVDGELLDAEHGELSDGLEAQAADENLEGGRDDFPVHEGVFAGLDDGVELFAGKVGAGGDEDVAVSLRATGERAGAGSAGKVMTPAKA